MGMYAGALGGLKRDLVLKKELEVKVEKLGKELDAYRKDYMDMMKNKKSNEMKDK